MYMSFASIKRLWGYTFGRNMSTNLPFQTAMEILVEFHGYDSVNEYAKSYAVDSE